MEEIKVPMNVREEFDASEINVGMNDKQREAEHAQVYADEAYVPEADERTLNVAERIKETSAFYTGETGYDEAPGEEAYDYGEVVEEEETTEETEEE